MTIKTSQNLAHWRYFLRLEDDLDNLARFIEFDERNNECFSTELGRLLMAASAETDVVCKQICASQGGNKKADNIMQYREVICATYSQFPLFEVAMPRFQISLMQPWQSWEGSKPPQWWTAYNKFKHNRNTDFHRASLKNALNSVAGLFVAVLHLYHQEAVSGQLLPAARLLFPKDYDQLNVIQLGYGYGFQYQI